MPISPRSSAEFRALSSHSQRDVKTKLLRKNFSTICKTLAPIHVQEFSEVLHQNELEVLTNTIGVSLQSKSQVITNLLMDLMRSSKINPSWWEVLDKVCHEHGYHDIYHAMNPWDQDHEDGAAAAQGRDDGRGGGDGRCGGNDGRNLGGYGRPDGGHGRGNGRGDGGGGPPNSSGPCAPKGPSPPRDRRGGSGPYDRHTPLSETHGIRATLRPLLDGGNDTLWRDLAEGLGLKMGTQLRIVEQAKGDDDAILYWLLIEFIKQDQDAATMDRLVSALWDLGRAGQDVVRLLEESKLIRPGEHTGGAADGELQNVFHDDERGGTSARASQAPSPKYPDKSNNQSFQPKVMKNKNVLSKHEDESSDNLQKSQSEIVAQAENQQSLNRGDSVVDNVCQPVSPVGTDTCSTEKVINTDQVSRSPPQAVEGNACEDNDGLETDAPSTPPLPSAEQYNPELNSSLSQNMDIPSQSQTGPYQSYSADPTLAAQSTHYHITNINIKHADNVMTGRTNKVKYVNQSEDGETDDSGPAGIPEEVLPIPINEACSGLTSHNEESGQNQRMPEINDDEYRPDPTDTAGHETHCKTPYTEEEEEEVGTEETREDFSIADLREQQWMPEEGPGHSDNMSEQMPSDYEGNDNASQNMEFSIPPQLDQNDDQDPPPQLNQTGHQTPSLALEERDQQNEPPQPQGQPGMLSRFFTWFSDNAQYME